MPASVCFCLHLVKCVIGIQLAQPRPVDPPRGVGVEPEGARTAATHFSKPRRGNREWSVLQGCHFLLDLLWNADIMESILWRRCVLHSLSLGFVIGFVMGVGLFSVVGVLAYFKIPPLPKTDPLVVLGIVSGGIVAMIGFVAIVETFFSRGPK